MNVPVLIGSSIPAGVEHLELHRELKLGDMVLTLLPETKEEALAVAGYCRRHGIYLCFSELLYRGSYDLCWAWRRKVPRDEFFSKGDLEEVFDAAGEYYFGRYAIGEAGGVLYWPKAYTIGRRARNWENLPPVRTMQEAKDAYIAYLKRWLDYERKELGRGPLVNVDSSLLFKYQAEAGVDKLCLEVMPGDPNLMHPAIRGAARAYGKPWGVHIAMACYGGVRLDELWQRRWKTSLYFAYIAGAEFILPESGHYTYDQGSGQRFGFHSRQMKRVRRTLRELYQFSRVHTRPEHGPLTALAVVHGNLDGTPGLWNRYAWGQYRGARWLEGPAERSWRLLDMFHRRQDWANPYVQGEEDLSGNPPYGQYDILPAEAPLSVMKNYNCLLFLGWNTMTPELYDKLKEYVKAGGRLVMFLPHLNVETDRAKPMRIFRDGDLRDLFGVKVLGRGGKDVRGVKCFADSSIRSWRFPRWRTNTDPRFMGLITPSKVEVTTAKVISAHDDFYTASEEELASRPIVVENSLGKGRAFLVLAWEYPGDDGLRPLAEDVVRTVLAGEQGSVRLSAPDRIRYAVYEGLLPPQRRKFTTIYMLNTDPDVDATARLWIRGRRSAAFVLPANELRLAWYCDGLLLLPEDKRADIRSWKAGRGRQDIRLYSVRDQHVEVHNLSDVRLRVTLNGLTHSVAPGAAAASRVRRTVDPARKEFFAPDFLEEPKVRYKAAGLPY